MDLIKIYDGHADLCRAAIAALKQGASAEYVALTHIQPHLPLLQLNTGDEIDPLEIASMLEFVVLNSHGQ